MAPSTGLTDENTRDNGRMGNNMELEFILLQVAKPKRDNGLKGKELLGYEQIHKCTETDTANEYLNIMA